MSQLADRQIYQEDRLIQIKSHQEERHCNNNIIQITIKIQDLLKWMNKIHSAVQMLEVE